jgi:hypothetical protein
MGKLFDSLVAPLLSMTCAVNKRFCKPFVSKGIRLRLLATRTSGPANSSPQLAKSSPRGNPRRISWRFHTRINSSISPSRGVRGRDHEEGLSLEATAEPFGEPTQLRGVANRLLSFV